MLSRHALPLLPSQGQKHMKTLILITALLSDPGFSAVRGDAFTAKRGELPKASKQQIEVDNRPEMLFASAPWCRNCKVPEGVLTPEVMKKLPFKIRKINTDTSDEYQGLIPAFRYKYPGGTRTITGWANLEFLVNDWKRFNPPVRAGPEGKRLTPEELRAFIKTYTDGDTTVSDHNYLYHLQEGNHGFSADQLKGLTQWELYRLHGAHHRNYLTPFKIGK